jgi:uncharacterized membrane protein YkvA (DUF1232 family)
MQSLLRLWQAFQLWRTAIRNPRTPALAKVLPWLGLVYVIWPLDIIPDFIPILGQLDDISVVIFFFWLALRLIPEDIKKETRKDIIDVKPHR